MHGLAQRHAQDPSSPIIGHLIDQFGGRMRRYAGRENAERGVVDAVQVSLSSVVHDSESTKNRA